MLKKLLISLICYVLMTGTPSVAFDPRGIASDKEIVEALNVLESTNSFNTLNVLSGKNPTNRPVRIMFYYLPSLNSSFTKVHALSTSDERGTMYILIHSRHRNAGKELLSCLIAHEATHQARVTTAQEEIQAWTNEVEQWIKIKKYYPSVVNNPQFSGELLTRMIHLEELYNKAHKTNALFYTEIARNPSYITLKN